MRLQYVFVLVGINVAWTGLSLARCVHHDTQIRTRHVLGLSHQAAHDQVLTAPVDTISTRDPPCYQAYQVT